MALKTLSTIRSELARWTGLDSSDTDHSSLIDDAVNSIHKEVHAIINPRFTTTPFVLNTVASYTTGTITSSSTTVTGSGTTFTSAMVGRYINAATKGEEVHKISSYTSGTSITLSEAFSSDVGTASSFTIFQSEYALPTGCDENNLLYLTNMTSSRKIYPVSLKEIESMYPNEGAVNTVEEPLHFSFVGRDSSNNVLIRFFPIPDTIIAYRGHYTNDLPTLSAGSSNLSVPERFEDVVLEGSKYLLFTWIGRADRAQIHQQRYAQWLKYYKVNEGSDQDYTPVLRNQFEDPYGLKGLRLPPEYPYPKK